jgi:hypothetical protein
VLRSLSLTWNSASPTRTQNPPLPMEKEQNTLFNEINVSAYIRPPRGAFYLFCTREPEKLLVCYLTSAKQCVCSESHLLSRECALCVWLAVVPLSSALARFSKVWFATAVYFADCLKADVGMTSITLCMMKLHSAYYNICKELCNIFVRQRVRQILITIGKEMHSRFLDYIYISTLKHITREVQFIDIF